MAAGAGVLTGQWPLLGREHELERVAAALANPDTTGVVLAGPAGVGKTRLASECLAIAERVGFTTARALATNAAAAIPLGALVPLLPEQHVRAERHADMVSDASAALAAVAGGQPLMLLVDDAHVLDEPSAAVLRHLAASKGAFVVVTVRTGAGSAAPARWNDASAERIDLDVLSEHDTARLVERVLDGPVAGATTHELHETSGGNPLYLRELLLGGVEAGLLRPDRGIWRLTHRLRASPRLTDLVEARLAGLSHTDRDALEIVALGEPIGRAELADLTDPGAVERCEAAGLVIVEPSERRRDVRLAHPLYGEVVRATMPALRSMRVNRLLADALEATGARRRENALRLAVWRLDGGGHIDPDLMLEAARGAHVAHDVALAERLARAALEAGAGIEAGLLLAEMLSDAGRHLEAEAVAAELPVSDADDATRAQVAVRRAEGLFRCLQRPDEAEAVLAAATSAIRDKGWRADMIAQQAVFDLLAGSPVAAVERVRGLLDSGEDRIVAHAATAAGPALAVMGRCAEAIAVADCGLAAHSARYANEMTADLGLHLASRALGLTEAGHLGDAEATARLGYDTAVDLRVGIGQAWFALLLGRATLFGGRLATADRWFREANAIFAELGHPGLQSWCLHGRLLVGAMTGDARTSTEARAELHTLTETPIHMMDPDLERARAWDALAVGERRTALVGYERAAGRAREMGAHALEAGALHDLVRIGEAEAALPRLSELAAIVDGPLTAARVAHARALAAGDAAALEAAADAFEACGAVLGAAEAAAQAAHTHRRGQSRRAAERCGRRAAALAERCEGARTPALALIGAARELTRREHEVATLAARGLANPAIADQLAVSRRTVENHLHRAFEKLGLGGRDELAGALDGIDRGRVRPGIE